MTARDKKGKFTKQVSQEETTPAPIGNRYDHCPRCGAPCKREVRMRGGDWGWSTSDEERAVYTYLPPQE